MMRTEPPWTRDGDTMLSITGQRTERLIWSSRLSGWVHPNTTAEEIEALRERMQALYGPRATAPHNRKHHMEYDWNKFFGAMAAKPGVVPNVIPLRSVAAADNLPPAADPWHGTTRRITGIGRDALEITPFEGLVNVEAIAWRDGCEAMLTLAQAREAHAALGAAIMEAEARGTVQVIKIVPGSPGGDAA